MRSCPWSEFDRADRIGHWDALAQWASEPNPFFESWFLLPALRALDASRHVKFLCLSVEGQLAGLMPITRSPRYYRYPFPHLANWAHSNCFLGTPLVALGCERVFWQEMLRWADSHAQASMFMHLIHLPLSGPLHEALEDVLADQSRLSGIVMRQERPMLASPHSAEDYLETVTSKKRRKEMRRQFNRLCEAGPTEFAWQWDEDDIVRWCEDFLLLEASGWKGKSGSALASTPDTSQFFRQSMLGAARKGKLVRLSLMHRGRPIAMLANLIDRPGSFGFKTAFDEEFSAFSPGVLLEREYLATLDRKDIAWCDSCAAPDHPVMSDLWAARRPIGRISIGIGGRLRRTAFEQILSLEMARQGEAARS
ncbi:GNAT family N-acetyltransferase [Alteraurantiacibacter aestuarii]|uniref:GNAT family N-acetyltransferase n=1 Tax=Alteraurantiacibacter aestuarii TaxID=650004 RepID=UPI0031D2793B